MRPTQGDTRQGVQEGSPAPAAARRREETPLETLSSLCAMLAAYLFVIAFIAQNFQIPSPSMIHTLLVGDHLVVDRQTPSLSSRWTPFLAARPVRRGDIIVFFKPHSETPGMILVKRAVAIAGDRIHLQDGSVWVNGVRQAEPYAVQPAGNDQVSYRDDFPSDLSGMKRWASSDLATRDLCQNTQPADPCLAQIAIDERALSWVQEIPRHLLGGDLIVPPGDVFAMGDNRADSLDSRFWGFVPEQNILGRPLFVYWSFQAPQNQPEPTSLSGQLAALFYQARHLWDGTRWRRTFHVVR